MTSRPTDEHGSSSSVLLIPLSWLVSSNIPNLAHPRLNSFLDSLSLNLTSTKQTSSKILVVGLVGGIGSGKSAVAKGLADHFTTLLINADQIGHAVLSFPKIKQQIRATFGDVVFLNDEVDRTALAKRVFGVGRRFVPDSEAGDQLEHKSALKQLEAIVHPEIRRQIEVQIEEFNNSQTVARLIPNEPRREPLVILDAPVMFEAGWDQVCDFVVFLEVPVETRLARVATRGWDADELRRRESNQWTMDEKRTAADAVVDNSGELKNAINQVKQLIAKQLST